MNTNGVMAPLILVWSFFLLYQPLEDERDEHDLEKGKAVGKGSQLDANKKAMSIQCKVCMQTFICTTSEAKCKEHAEAKHPKVDLVTCFPI